MGRPRRLFYGWVMVGAGFMNQAVIHGFGALGFGTYITPLEAEFGWSKTALAGGRSVMQVEQGLLGPVEGFMIDRLGPRLTMFLGVALFGGGLIALSRIHTLWTFYAAFVLIALGASIGGYLVLSAAMNNWFRRKRTRAMAFATMGFGFGAIAIVPLLVGMQGAFGWRTAAVASGLIAWGIGLPASLLMRRSPEDHGALPDGDPLPAAGSEARTQAQQQDRGGGLIDFTLKEALHTGGFWYVAFGHGMSGLAVSSTMVHVIPHMEQGIGLSSGTASIAIAVLGAVNILGWLTGGLVGDRLDKRYPSAIGMIGQAVAIIVVATATSFAQVLVFAVIFGFMWGFRGPMVGAMRGEYFGRAAFGKIMGTSSLITMPFSMAGPLFAGRMADIRGDYTIAFIILAILSAVGSILFLIARPPKPPARYASTLHEPPRV